MIHLVLYFYLESRYTDMLSLESRIILEKFRMVCWAGARDLGLRYFACSTFNDNTMLQDPRKVFFVIKREQNARNSS